MNAIHPEISFEPENWTKIWPKKLNTFELHHWTDPLGNPNDYCKEEITWEQLDRNPRFFDEKHFQERFWEKYKPFQVITENLNWTYKIREIKPIIVGWMWTDISSKTLIQEALDLNITWHMSSIWMWWTYDNPDVYVKWAEFKENYARVTKYFYELFQDKLWLPKEFIDKEFFDCLDENNDNFAVLKNPSARMFRMKDLIAIYEQASELKANWKDFWINCMYKTTSYFAAMKVAALARISFISTAAWFPGKCPKSTTTRFLKDVNQYLKTKINEVPAIWIIVSTHNMPPEIENYDYIILEDTKYAWWHLWPETQKDVLDAIRRIKEWKKYNWQPICLAWWFNSQERIKWALDNWIKWFQIWTLASVAQEARNWEWKKFKENNIALNHLWELNKNDIEMISTIQEGRKNVEWVLAQAQKDIFWITQSFMTNRVFDYIHSQIFAIDFNKTTALSDELDENWNRKEWKIQLDEQEQQIYEDLMENLWFFMRETLKTKYKASNINELIDKIIQEFQTTKNKRKRKMWDELTETLTKKDPNFKIENFVNKETNSVNEVLNYFYNIEMYKVLRTYGNALKFVKVFNDFFEENPWKVPTHLKADSVVWFKWRLRLLADCYKLLKKVNTPRCVECLNTCNLVERWNTNDESASRLCIVEWLDHRTQDEPEKCATQKIDDRLNHRTQYESEDNVIQQIKEIMDKIIINFTWTTTVPYWEIRPFKDIIAFLMWYYVKR